MDGSGVLLDKFSDALRKQDPTRRVVSIQYPEEEYLSYDELARLVSTRWIPQLLDGERGYVIVSQSYSAHVGLRLPVDSAKSANPALLGHVFVNAFAGTPLTIPRSAWRLFPRVLFSVPPPASLAARIFLGRGSYDSYDSYLAADMRKVQLKAAKVDPQVMSYRLRDCLSEDSWHRWRNTASFPDDRVQYLAGAADPLVGGTQMAQAMRSARNNVEFVEINNGPHLLLQRYGEECADAVNKFIQSLNTS